MKKALSLILALVLCLSLCACGNSGENTSKEDAFNNAQDAFSHITKAYLATNEFSQDIYEAWQLGVNDRYSYNDDYEFDDFAYEMHIAKEHIEKAVANLLKKSAFVESDWETLPGLYNDSYFSAWVSVISEAYKCSGQAEAISKDLTAAKDIMKSMSNEYSDYEHYPVLKEYFTNTLAFFDFCCNPEGSFEQVVETFNNYRNNSREHFFDLNYVFCDSISGMDQFEEDMKKAQNADGAESETTEAK